MRDIDYQGQEASVAASLRGTILSAFASLNDIAEAGDDHVLRVPHIRKTRWHLSRLLRLLNPMKPFEECAAEDIAANLTETLEFVRLSSPLEGEAGRKALRTLEHAIKWIEAAGDQLDDALLPGGGVKRWTPGGLDDES